MSRFLGLDISTQSASVIVIDIHSGLVVLDECVNFSSDLPTFPNEAGLLPHSNALVKHSDPLMWIAAIDVLFMRMIANGFKFSTIAAISGSGQQHGSVYLKRPFVVTDFAFDAGTELVDIIRPLLSRPTAPIWMDSSTTLECNEIATAATGDDVVRRITGSNVTERFTGPQIRSFSKSEEGAYNKTGRIHLVSSFVASVLCGEDVAIDRGDAAGMNLMDLSTSQWSDVMMHATARNLAAKLPPIVPSDSVVGQIGSYCVEKYGFVAGTPIVAFSGDNPNSLVGMGAHCSGTAVISLGTSDTYFASMSTADAAASEGNPYGSIFGNPAGGSFCLTCFKNGSLAREAVRDMFDMTWDAFSCSLRNTVSGNNGNMMLGYFVPEITPLVLVPGAQLFGDDEFVRWDCSGSTIRGIVEGQAMSMRYHACWMAAPTRVVMTGGASNNDEVVQVFADVFGVVVERLSVTNSAALGAAMRAAAAFSPPHITLDDICGQFACPEASKSIYPNSSAHAEYNALLPLFELRLRGYLGSLDKAVHS